MTDHSDMHVNGVATYLDYYQDLARITAIYPNEFAVSYPILGAIGELGEFANKYKKVLRDGITLDLNDAMHELGDILWYLANIAEDLNLSLGDIALANIEKLRDRKERGVIGGSGDTR